jgi:heme/copper-type cytochrome/quinol oxidase subunit 2
MVRYDRSIGGSLTGFRGQGSRWNVTGANVWILAMTAAFVGVCAYAVPRAQAGGDQARRVVRVAAERFAFTPSEIKVPHGTTIEFRITSDDTAHGFRILGQSIDLTIPKRGRGEAVVTFTPPEPGTYVFECSRMCGAGHSFMRGVIKVTAATQGHP